MINWIERDRIQLMTMTIIMMMMMMKWQEFDHTTMHTINKVRSIGSVDSANVILQVQKTHHMFVASTFKTQSYNGMISMLVCQKQNFFFSNSFHLIFALCVIHTCECCFYLSLSLFLLMLLYECDTSHMFFFIFLLWTLYI